MCLTLVTGLKQGILQMMIFSFLLAINVLDKETRKSYPLSKGSFLPPLYSIRRLIISISALMRFRAAVARSNFSRVGFLWPLFFFPLIALTSVLCYSVVVLTTVNSISNLSQIVKSFSENFLLFFWGVLKCPFGNAFMICVQERAASQTPQLKQSACPLQRRQNGKMALSQMVKLLPAQLTSLIVPWTTSWAGLIILK